MRRNFLLVLLLAMSAMLFSCGGDGSDGSNGLTGPAGSPRPAKVLVYGSDASSVSTRTLWLSGAGVLPPGSTINFINAGDSIPPVSEMKKYDVVLFYVNSLMGDAVGVGNRLADYVDAGGKLVMTHGAFITAFAPGGRIFDSEYSPYTTAAGAGDAATKAIDQATITFPIHPILVGIDVDGYLRVGLGALSVPGVRGDATVVFGFVGGLPGAAINAAKNILAVNDFPLTATSSYHALVSNCLLYMAGKI